MNNEGVAFFVGLTIGAATAFFVTWANMVDRPKGAVNQRTKELLNYTQPCTKDKNIEFNFQEEKWVCAFGEWKKL